MGKHPKALTIWQPYAAMIVGWEGQPEELRKRVENRTWRMGYRGELLIHAGMIMAALGERHGLPPPPMEAMPRGCLVGIAQVEACYSIEQIAVQHVGPDHGWVERHVHATGPYCIVLGNVRRFVEPIQATGAQGLWTPRPALQALVEAAELVEVA